jgi:hypothetical protein
MNKQRTPKGKPQGQARYRQTVSGAEVLATTTPLQNANNYTWAKSATCRQTGQPQQPQNCLLFSFLRNQTRSKRHFFLKVNRKKKLLPKVV